MLTSDTRTIRLRALTADGPVLIEEHPLDEPIRFADHRREDVRRLLADIMVRHGVELVHIRHIVKTTLDVFDVANDLDIPYVVSFHDYYMSCPTVHLLDDNDQFCGGVCTPGDGRCRIPMAWIAETAPHLKHSGVHEWRDLMRPRLERAAALITTSDTARSVYLRSYPSLDPSRFHLIEHGRDLDPTPVGWNPPAPDDRIRILIPGNLDVHKGSDLLRGMLELDRDRRLELHQLGDVDDSTKLLATTHGTYERDEFPDRVREIGPHLIGIFSITAETYNHSLSEAWMTGVPVVATDLGALGERIRAHGGGFLVPHDDPAEALRRILEIADNPDDLAALSSVAPTAVRTIATMGEDYDVVYRNAIAERRALAPVPPLRIGLVVLGSRSEAPGSVHVRSLRPLSHPALQGDITVRLMTPAALRAGTPEIDLAIVQRTAIPPSEVAATIRALDEAAVPLVVEVDDLLFDAELLPEGDTDWSVHVTAVGELMRAADLVSVSTDVIAERAMTLNPNVSTIANHLDERLWFHEATDGAAADDGAAPLRLLYMGSKTHDADLHLLEPVLGELRDRLERPVELDVIGGTSRDVTWFNKVPVPRNTANYPAFARWLATMAPGHRVALAPLIDTPFTRAKSDLKWLEYTALGLPGVFSKVSAYAGTVTDGETGLLVDNEPGAWVAAIERLATDAALAVAIVANARAEIVARRILDRRVRERLAAYRAICRDDHGPRMAQQPNDVALPPT
jgi:glycosyltransferase involved in cell wall biosynthesis